MSDTPDSSETKTNATTPKPLGAPLKRRVLNVAQVNKPNVQFNSDAATVVAKPRFLTPELRAKLEQEEVAAQSQAIEEARLAEEARLLEEARLIEEARLLEEARVAEEARLIEEARLAEEARLVEEARLAEEAQLHSAQEAEMMRLQQEQEAQEAASQAAAVEAAPSTVDPAIAEAFEKIRQAQEALMKAQQAAGMLPATESAVPAPVAVSMPNATPPEPTLAVQTPVTMPVVASPFATPGAVVGGDAGSPVVPVLKKPSFKTPSLKPVAAPVSAVEAAPTEPLVSDMTASVPPPSLGAPLMPSVANVSAVLKKPAVGISPLSRPAMSSASGTAQAADDQWGQIGIPPAKPSFFATRQGKIILMVSVAVILLLGGFAYMNHLKVQRQNEEQRYYKKLQDKGAKLGFNSVYQVTDQSRAGVEVKPSLTDAKMILQRLRAPQGAAPKGWESAAHYLALMGQADPVIAQEIVDTMVDNSKNYIDNQYKLIFTLLAAKKDGVTKKLLNTAIEKMAKDPGRQAIVLRCARWTFEDSDMPRILTMVADPANKNAMLSASTVVAQRILEKAADKEAMAKLIVSAMDSATDDRKGQFYKLLAVSGSDVALDFFKQLAAKSPADMLSVLVILKSWPNDKVLPFLFEVQEKIAADSANPAQKPISAEVDSTISTMVMNDVDRTPEEVDRLFKPIMAQFADTSGLKDMVDALEEMKKDDPKYKEVSTQVQALLKAQKAKLGLIIGLKFTSERPYVLKMLNDLVKDTDAKVSYEAEKTLESLKKKTELLKKNPPKEAKKTVKPEDDMGADIPKASK